ncbi:MAG: sigma-54-dependent Fis family transcriptional regulator, partial [candidate division Zixibacteria bacterium]|nr:sigma-54-dependent Fis family transcriptional regulator [candidate division Zixibacteria bacterium]
MKYSVLVVDDDKLVNDVITETVKRAGYDCVSVHSGEEALEKFEKKTFDIVLTDYRMKEMDGIALLENIKGLNPEVEVVIMTAYGTIERAVKAVKSQAYDFLQKPVSPDHLEHVLTRISEKLQIKTENEILRKDLACKFQNIIGKTKMMREIFDQI